VDALAIYLTCHRPVLLQGNSATALWIGVTGQPLSEITIRYNIIERTRAAFGVPINPHLFRDCAATTLALEDPAHVGAAATILGHASSLTTHKHYIQANTLAASRRHLAALAARRRSAPGSR
jgi:site-specific recombinase XerD